ncbi:MAG: LuxR C-terminal-related transcriptional regulator [Candidatus Bathyarchaeia archaeon]
MEKKEIKVRDECCYTCSKLYNLECSESLTSKCRQYKPVELDRTAVSTRYIEAIQKLLTDIKALQLIELEMKLAEKTDQLSKLKEKVVQKEVKEPEKPAISKRNKEIIALIEQGKSVKEIARELNLKPETVAKELEYLLKNGMVKSVPS